MRVVKKCFLRLIFKAKHWFKQVVANFPLKEPRHTCMHKIVFSLVISLKALTYFSARIFNAQRK